MEFIPFRPSLYGPFETRFYNRARDLVELQQASPLNSSKAIEDLIQAEVQWAVGEIAINPQQRRVYRAAWLLLRDLLHVGWKARWHSETFQILPPNYLDKASSIEEMQAQKSAMRFAMAQSRNAKIAEAKEFITRVENPSQYATASAPITVLIADGKQLANELRLIRQCASEDEQLGELQRVIQPYLQLVLEDERCSHTGHKLTDIWRYFRYTWAVPAESTPGRTLHYLIRDAAKPHHPVIGIASLENAVIRSPDRDHELGWSTRTIGKQLVAARDDTQVRHILETLLYHIQTSIEEVKWEGLCTEEEIAHPTRDTVRRLLSTANQAAEERKLALDEWKQEKALGKVSGRIGAKAEAALFRSKRASRLYRLLSAKRELVEVLESDDFVRAWVSFIGQISEDGTVLREEARTVFRTAIRAVKARHIGTSILELNVCGSIPPYNEILAGKLVALMMLSPQVVADYQKRYGERPSDIASKMKGEPVIRPAELVFIGTTSLYRVGASQYNRLKLPSSLLRPSAPEVRWKEIGETAGYGTLHISADTLQSLLEASLADGGAYVNNVFGEGASPKLRSLRHAISAVLDLDQTHSSIELTQHTMSRLIYGAWLASNGREFLSGQAEQPDYYFDSQTPVEEQTEKIVDFWRRRWLLNRIAYEEALSRMETFSLEDLRLGKELEQIERHEFLPINEEVSTMSESDDHGGEEWRNFVRHLYRGTSAYADRMDSRLLRMLHVKTRLDSAIIDAIGQGCSVVLTGNPGDGKTHLLRMLESKLRKLSSSPEVEYDASAKTDIELLEKWQQALDAGKPFCVAINEAVLLNLSKSGNRLDFPDAMRQVGFAQQQVEQAITYDASDNYEGGSQEVIVFDLSRRNVLSRDVVSSVVDILADNDRLLPCDTTVQDDLSLNIRLLNNELVQERLQAILDRVSQRGYHATIRELQSLISYLLFADRNCAQIVRESGNFEKAFPQLVFTGKGSLFHEIRQTFDPSYISHPIWDDLLVTAQTSLEDWLAEWNEAHAEISALSPADSDKFEARKRAFYFFHEQGEQLLKLAGTDETAFGDFLEQVQRDNENREALRLIISRINRFFGNQDGRFLRIWQSHRYDQSPRRILYSAINRRSADFELVAPRLCTTMQRGFDLAVDHVLLRLRENPKVKIRIDFPLFRLLSQAEQGVPAIAIENDLTRRIWQFMEQLTSRDELQRSPAEIHISDLTTGEKLVVELDPEYAQYLAIKEDD